MSSDGTISTRDASRISPLPQAQDISQELLYATCRENACLRQEVRDFEKEVQLGQQSLSDRAQEYTRLVSDLWHSQKAVVDLQASANNMHCQLRQQAAMMASIKGQNAEILESKEHEVQKRIQAEEQLDVERHLNAQFLDLIEAFKFMDREDPGDLIGDKLDFGGVLASHSTIARHVERMKQDNAANDKVLEGYKGLHQHLYYIL